jgi:sulfite exporter TauE/SafE
MLSSIHPLGERARHNKWAITVIAFSVGAVGAGAGLGGALGLVGSWFAGSLPASVPLVLTAAAAVGAGILDLSGARPPGPSRQVNETWIGTFRGWVYGGGFGVELGLGFMTYVVTWAVYASYLGAVLTGSVWLGALVGATFGLGRSLSLLAAGYVDRPSRLTSFNRRLAIAGPLVRRGSAMAITAAGMALLIVGLI